MDKLEKEIIKEEERGRNRDRDRDRDRERERKRGRRPKNEKKVYLLDKSQQKFFVDLSHEKVELDLIFGLLERANQKDYGREVLFKDLAIYALGKLNDKDILRIQELTLSKKEKLERQVSEYNQKNGTTLSFEDYFLMKEGIKL